ncbi:MAG: hypothetical protein GY810_13115 [Aureispira sp.]|nr:hypothetical protein [Aureispira sp.]
MKIAYLFIFVLFIAACSKEESCVHRLEGDWILSATTVFANGVEVVDTSSTIDSLEETTTVVFSGYDEGLDQGNMSKVYLVVSIDSVGKRTVDSSSVISQKYKVSAACNQILMEGSSDTTTATITELTKSTLIYEYIVDGDSIEYKYTETLDKK